MLRIEGDLQCIDGRMGTRADLRAVREEDEGGRRTSRDRRRDCGLDSVVRPGLERVSQESGTMDSSQKTMSCI